MGVGQCEKERENERGHYQIPHLHARCVFPYLFTSPFSIIFPLKFFFLCLSLFLSTKNSFSTNLKLKVFWPSLSLSFSIFLCYFLSFSVTFSASNKLVLLNLCSHRSRKSKRETFGGTNYKMKELCFLFVSEL